MRLAVAVALVATLGCASGPAGSPAPPAGPVPVKTVAVGVSSLERTTSAVGTIEAARTAELHPEGGGTVVSVGFEDGDTVGAGAILVRLRDDAARADLDAARARLRLADQRLQRLGALHAGENASADELDAATAEVALAKAGVDRAEDALARTQVRAPFAGVMGRRLVDVGDLADPGHPVGRIEDLASVTVDAALPEKWLAELTVGAAVKVAVDAWPAEAFAGTLVYVAPRLDAATRTVPVRVRVENPDGRLRPGLTARVDVGVGRDDGVVLVPTQAVQATASGAQVYVVVDGKAEKRPVRLGARREADVEVLEGLAAGDRLIVEGLVKIRPGVAVAE